MAGIALQLYTVREHVTRDMVGTLRQLAAVGYRAVELAGYGGIPVDRIRATLDELGMRSAGAHVASDRFDRELDQVVAEMQTLGSPHVTIPWLSEEHRAIEGVPALAETFNRWGERCRGAGLRLGYHNHAFEFEQTDPATGATFFSRLVELTDPALVDLQLDVYWAAYAGLEPIGLIERLAGRLPSIHVKDMAITGTGERRDAPVGEGVLPWSSILPAAAAAGTEWFIVEQDNPANPLADVGVSLRNLERLLADAR